MSEKEIEMLLNYNFRDYLKSRLDEHDMNLRELSSKAHLSYGILSKIIAAKSKTRNVKYHEFLIILDALGEDVDDFLDYALKRPKQLSNMRRFIKQLDPEALVLLSNLLNRISPEDVKRFLWIMNEAALCFSKTGERNDTKDGNKQGKRK